MLCWPPTTVSTQTDRWCHTFFVLSGHCTSPSPTNTLLYSSVRHFLQHHMMSEVLNSSAVSFLAIVPLAKVCLHSAPPLSTIHSPHLNPQLLAFATDELSIRVGETLAGLLNATLVRHFISPHAHLSNPSAHPHSCPLVG